MISGYLNVAEFLSIKIVDIDTSFHSLLAVISYGVYVMVLFYMEILVKISSLVGLYFITSREIFVWPSNF